MNWSEEFDEVYRAYLGAVHIALTNIRKHCNVLIPSIGEILRCNSTKLDEREVSDRLNAIIGAAFLLHQICSKDDNTVDNRSSK